MFSQNILKSSETAETIEQSETGREMTLTTKLEKTTRKSSERTSKIDKNRNALRNADLVTMSLNAFQANKHNKIIFLKIRID